MLAAWDAGDDSIWLADCARFNEVVEVDEAMLLSLREAAGRNTEANRSQPIGFDGRFDAGPESMDCDTAAAAADRRGAPGRGSKDRHSDVRGSVPQVVDAQDGAPD
jgi:hypothetical protein